MTITYDPENDLNELASYGKPVLATSSYNQFGQTIVACVKVPMENPGPGGIIEPATLAYTAQMLKAFSAVIPQLNGEQFAVIQAYFHPNTDGQQGDLRNQVNLAVRYLTALEGRDAFLQTALAGIMSATA
jgi:hypothetical protein